MPEVQLYSLEYAKEDLERAPPGEATLYLLLGHISNDLNILSKLAIFAMNDDPSSPEPTRRARNTAAMLLVRLLAGRLYEAWSAMKGPISRLIPSYAADLGSESVENWKFINRYFSQPNVIRDLRNKLSFHSDAGAISAGYAALPPDADFVDYLSIHQGNTLYFGGEFLSMSAMTKVSAKDDPHEAMDEIVAHTTTFAGRLGDFINEFVRVFAERHLAVTPDELLAHVIKFDAPPLDAITLEYFCAPPSSVA